MQPATGAWRRAAGRAADFAGAAEADAWRRPDELAAPFAFAVVRLLVAISTAPASAGYR